MQPFTVDPSVERSTGTSQEQAQAQAIITFRASAPCAASPDAVYDVLSDLRTHVVWAGEQAPRRDFKLLALEGPAGPATIGDRFSSDGAANDKATFHDRSVVVQASRPDRFGFDTESTLERRRRPTWHARFAHRYAIDADGTGARISYTCHAWPQNYVPYWLIAMMRPMTRVMVQRAMRAHLANLAAMAESDRAD